MSEIHRLLQRLFPLVNDSELETLPLLPDDSLSAFMTFLRLIDNSEFYTYPLEITEETLLMSALREDGYSVLVSSVGVSELIVFWVPWWQDTSFYIDPYPDSAGNYRVYVRDEACYHGRPWGIFPSIEAAVTCFCEAAEEKRDDAMWTELSDSHEQSPLSGGFVLEAMLELDLAYLWELAREKRFEPDTDIITIETDARDASPSWQRRICLAMMQSLVGTGHFQLPAPLPGELLESHRLFLDHLKMLEEALNGDVPSRFREVANNPKHRHQAAALEWLDAFEL